MNCKTCKYLGVKLEHLNGLENCNDWYACNYPLPYNVIPKAVRTDIEIFCKVYTPKKTIK